MSLLLCMLAGGIAANMAASLLPHRSIHGIINIAFGIAAGAGVWSLIADIAAYPPSLGALLVMMSAGGAGGVVATLALGGVRNAVVGHGVHS